MLRGEDQLGTGLETQASLPVGRDVCGLCGRGRASLGGGTQGQWEAAEQAGGVGEAHGEAARGPVLDERDCGGAGKGEDDEGTEMRRAQGKADRA